MNLGEGLGTRGYAFENEGVILDNPLVCGKCVIEMHEVSDHNYKCTGCGVLFHDEEVS